MNNTRLYTLLNDFVNNYGNKDFDLKEEFQKIAKEIIFGGHFEVELTNNEGNKIKDTFRIIDVEAYFFNEEKPEIRGNDWIMYHRSYFSWSKEGRKKNEDFSYPYLSLGTLFTHKSGTDLTFEKKDKFRASLLLRSYIENGNGYVETYPTYLSDDMHLNINPFEGTPKVSWVENEGPHDGSALKSTFRLNVAEYSDYNESEKKEPHKLEASNDSEDTFKSGKKIYLQDTRNWRFYDSKFEKDLKLK